MTLRTRLFCFAALLSLGAGAQAAETVKLAYIDPISGPFALQGQTNLHHVQAAVDAINARGGVMGGVKIEVVSLDHKMTAQDGLLAFKQAVDRGIRIAMMTSGSNVAGAISDAASKHNARNPDKSVLFLNSGAIDPALTNDKCNFWHFRFDVTTDMKVDAITTYMARQPNIKKVYLINQDYAFGQSVSRAAKDMLPKKRADLKVVGDDLHPVGKVKDFSPYVGKIKASGADSVITGNWGPDLSLLVRATKDAGLHVDYYSLYAYTPGIPASIGAYGADHVKTLSSWHANVADNKLDKFAADYRKKYNEDYSHQPIKIAIDMLAKAMDQANSGDPLKLALTLEGMKYQSDTGEVVMRADDHQISEPLFISTFTKTGGALKYDTENTGFGWRTETRFDAKDVVLPTTCKMTRP